MRRFCQKLHGISSRGQKLLFFRLMRAAEWMDIGMLLFFFFEDDLVHTVQPIEMKLNHYLNKMKRVISLLYISARKH